MALVGSAEHAPAVREDRWLSDVLERPVFAVEGDADASGTPPGALLYAKVPTTDVALAGRLCARGFVPVDVAVTLSRGPAPAGDPAAEVVTALPDHSAELLDIAGSCFRFSRFHLDPVLPAELAHRVKREWVRSYIEGRRGVELLVALDGGRVAGFLAVLADGDARVIDLVGVAPAAQGRGFGGALVREFVARHGPRASELRVGTQIANVPSLRLYAAHRFGVSSSSFVLHLHTQ